MKIFEFPIHSYLLAIYPIIFIFSRNYKETPLFYIKIPLAVAIIVAFFMLVFGMLVFKNLSKAGIFSSLFMLIFYAYGHVYKFFLAIDNMLVEHKYLFIIFFLSFLLTSSFLKRKKGNLVFFTKMLNFFGILLITFTLLNITLEAYKKGRKVDVVHDVVLGEQGKGKNSSPELPDIYYIILDGYAHADTLKSVFGYDNSEFINYLKNNGFFVATKGRSNYVQTGLSIPSALNMEHYTYLEGKEKPNILQLFDIGNGKIINLLKSRGYKFKYYGTYNNLDMPNSVKINDFINDFTLTLLRGTMLVAFEDQILLLFYVDERRGRVQSALAAMAEDSKSNNPMFIFAHILPPHPPFVFNRQGGLPRNLKAIRGDWEFPENYLDQLVYINSKIKTLVDNIKKNSRINPIIIIQGDHGSATLFKKEEDWISPTDEMLNESFRILNAYYIPSCCQQHLYHTITPVNTFRVVLNCLFNENLKMLDDKMYFISYGGYKKYHFIDVTDRTSF